MASDAGESKLGDAERTPVDIVVAIDITAREQFASRYNLARAVARESDAHLKETM